MFTLKPICSDFEIEGFYTAFHFHWTDFFAFNVGESHNFWEVVFVESGSVEVTEDENAYTLSEGTVIFHAPMEFHRIRSAAGSTPKGFIFSFQSSGALPNVIKRGVFALDASQRKLYDALRESIYHFAHEDASSCAGMKAVALLKLFVLKIAERPVMVGSSTVHSALEYQRISSFMAKNSFENLTLDDIATQTNISVSYMKFLFHTYAGIGPKKYFNQLRIQRATELLQNGHSVTDVSTIMNFSSPNYFSVFFKKHTGVPPSQQH